MLRMPKPRKHKFVLQHIEQPWTLFRQVATTGTPDPGVQGPPGGTVANSRYIVNLYQYDTPRVGIVTQLAIRRVDGGEVQSWDDIQRVKNEVLGTDVEACEIYPAEVRRVASGRRHYLWCLPAKQAFPFGFFPNIPDDPKPIYSSNEDLVLNTPE